MPSVRFSVESGAKKKEGVSQQLCLAGQKGDTHVISNRETSITGCD
jgi:hypothetical protein